MPKTIKPPSYRLYKRTGQAVVTLNGRDFYLGRHGTKVSLDAYDRLIAEWLANGRRLPVEEADSAVITVSEVLAAFFHHANTYYRKDGRPTKEVGHFKTIMKVLRQHHGRIPARDFGPLKLKAIRQRFVDQEQSRKYINRNVDRVKRIFKWAAENELLPATIYQALQTVSGLRRGRSEARENAPIRPVPEAHVDAIRPHVARQVWACVELQRLTGMRPGEVLAIRSCDLDITGKLWLYRPESHKTEHHGHDRVVEIGPRAQQVIRPFLKPDLEAYLFSPADAEAERRASMHAKRKTPMSCGNRPGTNRKRKPKRTPKERYTPDSYRRAIARACDLADREAKKRKNLPPDSERIVPRWHPHQLRHNYATMIRREYGIETARILLGHRSAFTTEIYAEADRMKARKIVAKIG